MQLRFTLLLISCLLVGTLHAQQHDKSLPAQTEQNSKGVWRKSVMRTIGLPYEKVKDNKAVLTTEWQSFLRQFFADVMLTRFPVYRYANLTEVFDSATLNRPPHGEDSIIRTDPVTGKDSTYVRDRSEHYERILAFRLREEWTYDQETGKTKIEIIAFAPLKDVYGDDGVYRGAQGMVWIKWAAFQKYLKTYTAFDVSKKLGEYLAADYLKDTAIVTINKEKPVYDELEKIWTISSLRNVTIFPDGTENTLYDSYLTDSSITALLHKAAFSGYINAYKNEFNNPTSILSSEELGEITKAIRDTTILECVMGGDYNATRIIVREFCYECIHDFYVKEKWILDIQNGLCELFNKWIAPVSEEVEGKYVAPTPLFWIKYKNTKNILSRYNEYHPVQNIDYQLWDSRFKEPWHPRPTYLKAE